MKNPLSLEERTFINDNLIDHDVGAIRSTLIQCLYTKVRRNVEIISPEKQLAYTLHVSHFYEALRLLNHDDREAVIKHSGKTIQENLERSKEVVHHWYKADISFFVDLGKKIEVVLPLLYTQIFNLVKNSAQHVNPEKGKIMINVSKFSGVIVNPIYVSDATPIDGDFIRLNINDNGDGFPIGIPLSDFFKLDSPKDGFGLPYVALVCKYLRSHLAIDSKPGNTNVAIYHPLKLT